MGVGPHQRAGSDAAVGSQPKPGRTSALSGPKAAFRRMFTVLTSGVRSIIRPRSIRAKLIRILAFSLVLVFVLLGFLVVGQINAFSTADQTSRTVLVALSAQGVVHELQEERALTNGVLGGAMEFGTQLGPQRARTDSAIAKLNSTIDDPANADAGAAQVRSAIVSLAGLGGIRQAVDSGSAESQSTFEFYSDAISAINNLNLGVDEAQDGILRRGLQALYALGNAKEYIGQEGGLLDAVFAGTKFTPDNYTTFATILGEKAAALADFQSFATQNENDALAGALTTSAATVTVEYEGTAVAGVGGTLPVTVNPTTWGNAITTVINDLRGVQQSVGADITARANTLAAGATRLLIVIGVLALLTIAAMVALVIGAAKSVIGPLGQLAKEADDVSARRLPDAVAALQSASDAAGVPPPAPVAVPSGAASEIALMAGALDRVQGAALSLASQQALIRHNTTASLANLGRRNQNLVRRQLSLISKFEQEELDPSALSNMFELDHLATRMRRNAESLLVLVGESSPRPSAQPLPVADVIRAALSEVEDYRRVVLRRVDDALISGPVVTEVAHMLAELVENGLMFSPPDVEVEIYGRRTGDRYLLVVVDYGVGMSAADLAKARARLRDEENFLVAPTRFLGHYVVGRLAKQLKIAVELGDSPVTGITARMLLPADLIIDPSAGTKPTPAKNPPVPAQNRGQRPAASQPLARLNGADPIGTNGVSTNGLTTNGARTNEARTNGARADGARTNGERPAPRQPSRPAVPSRQLPAPVTGPPTAPRPTSPAASGRNGSHAGPVERTRNGLVKRQVSGDNATRPTAPPRLPLAGRPVNGGGPNGGQGGQHRERSANEVGGMLAAFSRGHQRGEAHGHGPGQPGREQTGRTNGRPSPLVQEEDSR
ncbi:MAG TPA: nitrate- and nitrite sensing domain-containing protein [Pseudonocardiaceae bacterium]|nr:nitrate- and nitrite sensing domain-containing protein [Pseudonocardiaceae bacterium]